MLSTFMITETGFNFSFGLLIYLDLRFLKFTLCSSPAIS